MARTQEIFIECGAGENAYQVILTGRSLDVFEAAAQKKEVQGKTGEELVSALLSVTGAVGISKVERKTIKDGLYNDGPNGEPCYIEYYEGKLRDVRHGKNNMLNDTADGEPARKEYSYASKVHPEKISRYKNGKLNDGPNGEPAFQAFSFHGTKDGPKLQWEEHRKEDLRHDGVNGEPAVQGFHSYYGTLSRIEHWQNGKCSDTASGKPAVQKFFANGTVEYVESWKDGEPVKKTTGEELRAVLKQPETAKKIQSITAANPAIKVRHN